MVRIHGKELPPKKKLDASEILHFDTISSIDVPPSSISHADNNKKIQANSSQSSSVHWLTPTPLVGQIIIQLPVDYKGRYRKRRIDRYSAFKGWNSGLDQVKVDGAVVARLRFLERHRTPSSGGGAIYSGVRPEVQATGGICLHHLYIICYYKIMCLHNGVTVKGKSKVAAQRCLAQ